MTPKIPNKKRTFIKNNFKQLSIEELACRTALKQDVIKLLMDEYRDETTGKDQSAQEKRDGIFLSWKIILLTSLLFVVTAIIIYSPSLHGDFVFDDKRSIQENPLIHITSISQITDLLFSKKQGRIIGYMSFALNYYLGGVKHLWLSSGKRDYSYLKWPRPLSPLLYNLNPSLSYGERERKCPCYFFPGKPYLAYSSYPDSGSLLYCPTADQSFYPLLSALFALLRKGESISGP